MNRTIGHNSRRRTTWRAGACLLVSIVVVSVVVALGGGVPGKQESRTTRLLVMEACQNTGVPDAEIEAVPAGAFERLRIGKTDSTGRATIDIQAGTALLLVCKSGFECTAIPMDEFGRFGELDVTMARWTIR